jgi:hypothetical protein
MTPKTAECHPTRKIAARGMCGACYDRYLRETNPQYKERQRANSRKWREQNSEKCKAYERRRRERLSKDPEYKKTRRDQMLRSKYGITSEDYEAMLAKQNNGCAICGRAPGKFKLHVDHDHATGRVRGILCHQCNWYLGTIDANPEILQRIEEYRK